jgi:aspartate racemase
MHKRIGIIGGLSPESTASYYLHITRSYVRQFGADSYPEIIIYSVDLEQYHAWREQNRWDLITDDLVRIANTLNAAGAELGIIATNTMHKVFKEVQHGTTLPLLHILEPTVAAIKAAGLTKIGMLGTRFTMAEDFYKNYLHEKGITVVVPRASSQDVIHEIIMTELVRGVLKQESKVRYLAIIEQLIADGAEGIILGCTEIPLLIDQASCQVPVFDTAILHAEAVLQAAIKA